MAGDLESLRVVVLYGPTRAYLDPVRYLSNTSTGALGALIIEAFVARGARVDAVAGPGAARPEDHPRVRLYPVETVEQVLETAHNLLEAPADVIVMAMAVLDYVPCPLPDKRHADGEPWTLVLQPAPKVIDRLRRWAPHALLVGFKLESDTAQLLPRARQLQTRCGADVVVANLVTETSMEKHRAVLIGPGGVLSGQLRTGKEALAVDLVDAIVARLRERSPAP